MPVPLSEIRSMLLPGLWEVTGTYNSIPRQWTKVFSVLVEPALMVPLPVAAAMGAAAVVIANPETTRRGLLSWWSS